MPSSSTAGRVAPPGRGPRSTPSSASCAPSPTTRRCSSRAASRSACSGPTSGRRGCSSPTPTSSPRWATWEVFRELEAAGLMMYGQMTAGSWIYIGTQGILQGTYETFAELARQHFGGSLRGTRHPDGRARRDGRGPAAGRDDERWGGDLHRGRPGARPPSSRDRLCRPADRGSAGGAGLGPRRDRRARAAVDRPRSATPPRSSRPGRRPASGSTSSPTRPAPTMRSAATSRPRSAWPMRSCSGRPSPTSTSVGRCTRWRPRCERCSRSRGPERSSSTTATTCGRMAKEAGVEDAFAYPGFVPAFIRPLFCEGRGPFRWVALAGDPEDIYRTDRALLELFPDDAGSAAGSRWPASGSRSRGCRPGSAGSATASGRRAGLAFNELVAAGEVTAPIVIGRDHLDSGSVASPNRETEAMRDGSDAVADWPLLNALVNTAAGASWVIDPPRRRSRASATASTPGWWSSPTARRSPREKLERVLTTDPGDGRDPPRGRRLRARDRGRPGARRPHPDARRRKLTGATPDPLPAARVERRSRARRSRRRRRAARCRRRSAALGVGDPFELRTGENRIGTNAKQPRMPPTRSPRGRRSRSRGCRR